MEKENEEDKSSTEDSGEGDNPKATEVIERADATAERMEKATQAQKEENDRTERLMVRNALSGRASAGGEAAKPEEISNEAYARKALGNELPEDGKKE